MPDLFPTTEEAAQDQAREIGIVNHLGPDSFKPDGLPVSPPLDETRARSLAKDLLEALRAAAR